MKVSQKAEYAFRAMLDLALNAQAAQPLRSSDIAERTGVPEKFLEAILVELRKADLIQSRRGPDGGHRLARPASKISAAEIRQAADGPLVLAPEGRSQGTAVNADACLREFWTGIEAGIRQMFEAVTLEDLRRHAEAKRSVPDYSI